MLNEAKIELLESVKILHDLANKASLSFPSEVCRFFVDEFNLKFAAIYKEENDNIFEVVSKSSNSDNSLQNKNINVTEYELLLDSTKFENNYVSECRLSLDNIPTNLTSFFLSISEDKRFLLVLQSKNLPSNSERQKFISLAKFLQQYLKVWIKSEEKQIGNQNINSLDFVLKTTRGLVKDIKTISGLLTLIKEENLSNSVDNYTNEIKTLNGSLLESINDFAQLARIETNNIDFNEKSIVLNELVEKSINNLKNVFGNLNFELIKNSKDDILFDESILEFIIYTSAQFISTISRSKNISINSQTTADNILRLSFVTDSIQIEKDKIDNLIEPFEIREYFNQQSGLALTLVAKYIDLLKGTYKFIDDTTGFSLNIALPIKKNISNSISEIIPINSSNSKDKILVIESDNASSKLLKNYLNKWDYQTEFVNSGNHALRLLGENKYVAVILNIEQENENSLVLLQKIKNTKATRSTPVIVFSVEADKEKIYLMGSVEYLVKPINYNNLVEILTSYKLRRNSTVLCVDDDKPTLSLVKQAVQTAGFNVIAEHRPELVMELIKGKELDLAIIDLDMPIINGFDLIKKIKSEENFSKLPIIIYTGKEDYQEDLQKIDGMFVDLLHKKSTSFNELENTITAMIKSYEEPKNITENSEETSGPKILMAEDYKHSQIIVTRLLKKSGFENIIVVENGEEALNICENDKIDLVLMDMQMPVMNGFEATGKIRELEGYKDTPIIALTAFAMKGDREKCLEAGATDYIPKPIDSKEFIEKVKYYTQITISA